MKLLRYTILIVLLFVSMSLVGIVLFWILENVFKFDFNNIIYAGIKSGIISSILLIVIDRFLNKKNK